ncbi:PKD domain-containing protein [Flectobacillus roseus]
MRKVFIFGLVILLALTEGFAQTIANFEVGGQIPSFYYGKDAKVVANPDKQMNTTNKVGYYKKEAGNWKFVSFTFDKKINTQTKDVLSLWVRSSTKGRVYLKLWNGNTVLTENWVNEYAFMPNPNTWTQGKYDLSKVPNQDFDRIELALSVDNEAEADAYFDELKLYNSASPNDEPVIILSKVNSKVQVGQSIAFDASKSYDVNALPLNFVWSFSDGSQLSGKQVSKTFNKSGNYQAQLTVTNTLGLLAKQTLQIYAIDPTQALSEPRWLNSAFETNQKIEAELVSLKDYTNPYNPDEVTVDAVVTRPDGSKQTVPCFYWIKGYYKNSQWRVDSTQQAWRWRYASNQIGLHQVVFTLKDAQGQKSTFPYIFTVKSSSQKGIIQRDSDSRQHYRHQTGEPYFPLGINVAWDSQTNYFTIFENLANAGANFVRYWQVPFNRQALEWKNDGYTGGLGKYSQQAAAMQDSILSHAEKRDIRLQLTLLQHGMFSENVNSNWSDNPYNVALGGPLNKAEEFFYNATAKQQIKKLFRYNIARWGYSSNVYAWELFNEVQFTGNHPNQSATWKTGVLTWHDEMSQYIKSIDPFNHVVTTSADDRQCVAMDKFVGLDNVQYHLYNTNLLPVQNQQDKYFKETLTKTGIINGEYGLDVNTADVPFDTQRIAIWTGILSRVPHLMWLWDNYKSADWANLFAIPAKFLQSKDFVKEKNLKDWTPAINTNNSSLTTLGLTSDKGAYLMVYDNQNKESISGIKIDLTTLTAGIYDLKFWNVLTGETTIQSNFNSILSGGAIILPTFSKAIFIEFVFKEKVTITGLEGEKQGFIKAYPNPFQQEINVDIMSAVGGDAQLVFCSSEGKELAQKSISIKANQEQKMVWDMGNQKLNTGTYILKLQIGQQQWSQKLLKSSNF